MNSYENGATSSGNKSDGEQVVVSAPPTSKRSDAPEPGGHLPTSKQSEEKDKQLSPPPAITEKSSKQLSPPPTHTEKSSKQSSPPPTNYKEGDKQLSYPPANTTRESPNQLSPPPTSSKETDEQLSPEVKETNEKLTPPRDNCDGTRIRCQILNTIRACVQNSESGKFLTLISSLCFLVKGAGVSLWG